MFKSALFIFFITTFLVYGQANPTAVFYNGSVYTLSVLSSDITIDEIDTGLVSFNIRKRGDINSVALYIADSNGVESPLYFKRDGKNVYLNTSNVQQDSKLGYAFSLLVPSNVYVYQNGIERRLSIGNFDSIIVRAFYNNNVYLDNALDVTFLLTDYISPKIEVLDIFLSRPNNIYAITLKYSGGENKNVSFYYRDGYDSRVYNLLEPLVKYNQTNATSIILKNTFNSGIGKEYIVKVYFNAENVDQYLFFNAFDEKGQTSTPPLQVILEAVYIEEPVAIAQPVEEPIVIASESTVIEEPESRVVTARTTTPRAETTVATTATIEPPIATKNEPTINASDLAQPTFLIDSSDNILSDDIFRDDIIVLEEPSDEAIVVENNGSFKKQYLTRQDFINFPTKIIDSIAKKRGTSLDVVFVLDVTASMHLALDGVKRYVDEIIVQMYNNYDRVRVGFVLFRDVGDDFVVKSSGYMTDKYDIKRFVYSLEASGGGDLPEPILDAMDCALLDFRFEAESRQMFVITDAPMKRSIYTTEKSLMDRLRTSNIDLQYFVLPVMK